MGKGVFLVIDGGDGSGKGTQARHLLERLRNEGRKVELVDFPRYDKPSGYFVQSYLNGVYGESNDVPPKLASMFYALDRYDASFDMKKKLGEGYILIANRYSTSNMAHQGGKVKDKKEREDFILWDDWLEHELAGIPKADKIIYLHVPVKKAQELIDKKESRDYIKNGEKDIHELDEEHLINSQMTYLEIVEMFDNAKKIVCVDESGEMRSVKDINDDIYKELLSLL
ncbi:thymidylate kinase [Candidatus Woesearchaeota archaeon]|nr:thymidylate kinase [Candidatus Woesearchaeota archaeon]